MSAIESKLASLSSTHDLKLVCAQCSVKQREITYSLKSVAHQCARDLLLCKAKGSSKWRPISRRPKFPNPSQYAVCCFFREDSGCTYHKNRCTFARSEEEAVVWTFAKRHGLDFVRLCCLLARPEHGSETPDHAKPAGGLLLPLDLKAACDLCSVKQKEITYAVRSVPHKCRRNLLLVKDKACDQWRPVSERPVRRFCGPNVYYQACHYFVEGCGCTRHGQDCNFARSEEEAAVWNYVRDNDIDVGELIRLVVESELVSVTPESAAERIVRHFPGEFLELCSECFRDRPPRLTTKRWNSTCAADAAHAWDPPVLVHHLSENGRKQVYSQVRPLPKDCQFQYCSHVRQGKPCWHQAGHCHAAQSEVEMAVWEAEQGGHAVRPLLLQLSRRDHGESRKVSMYCKVCLLALSSPESFYKHCASLEHAQLLAQDTSTRWSGRQPPHNHRSQFWLCERPKTCEYGINCPKAHSKEELQEWLMRAEEEKEIRHNMGAQGVMCYNERLLEEYKNSSNEVHVLSDQVDDVSVFCDEDLTVKSQQLDATLQWKFQVETERQLVHVALLKQEPGASFTLGDVGAEPCIYSPGRRFLTDDTTYDVTVSFAAANPGLYDQWLVLDFDIRPVLVKKLRVRAGQPSPDDDEQPPSANRGAALQSAERWHRGNRVIVPCSARTEENEELLKEYKPPQINFLYKSSSSDSQSPLTSHNYKERMHHFLYKEERAEDQIVSRLNVCGEVKMLDTLSSVQFGMIFAPRGELFCAVSIPYNLTPDHPEGLALKRSVQFGLVSPSSAGGQRSRVYEATILPEKMNENEMYLQLSKRCCSDLGLRPNESHHMEVQFQMNRISFCAMHKTVDLLPDTTRVLPDLRSCGVPANGLVCETLNQKQQSAIDFITGNSTAQKQVAPLLIYGPFGTGKTFALATAARELCKQPRNKVLICTHTNSSADLYVRDHFHPVISGTNGGLRAIRIKANTKTGLSATDDITLQYCLLSEDRQCFLPPSKTDLDFHQVVITTATMARPLHDLKLPEGYFTHILVDEASQMLECEALMALCLAGPNTRVVLAGDHMQMGPKLFSVDDHHRSDHTLLTRLFHYYQEQRCDAAQRSRLIFSENYRSTQEIVDFVSTHFYVGKNDVIKAEGNIPAPEDGRALKFHHVRGECLLDTCSMSWYNKEEVVKVVEAVKEILQLWPMVWGRKDESSICVLSEGAQVRQIRTALKRRCLAEVNVQNLANVQGKQFRVVVMTAVHTRDSLKTSHLPGLELFNDARVLNTAMTRAQSQVVVVGDAAALCCFGKCSGVWKSYVDHCVSNNSVAPPHFTKDYFEKDVMETARFQKSERVDESNARDDTILQELRGEYEQLNAEYSSDEDEPNGVDNSGRQTLRSSYQFGDVDPGIPELRAQKSEAIHEGKLVRETFNRGYVIPFKNPTRHVAIKGRANLGKGFTGDEVVVETAKVIRVTKEAEPARLLVCTLEDEDHTLPSRITLDGRYVKRSMIPLTKSAPKVRLLISRQKRNVLPIWEQIDGYWNIRGYERLSEKLKQENVFVVQVIGWRESNYMPLGYVVDILPIGESLAFGLRILNEEFKVEPNEYVSDSRLSYRDEDEAHRQDLKDVITFTVDPEGAKDLDDAISLSDNSDHFELGIHIADVASFVRPNDDLDEIAKRRGATYYCGKDDPYHMFPPHLSTGHFSLLPGKVRRVVSLILKVNKETNEIMEKPEFQLSLIKSDQQLSYEEAEDIITEGYRDEPGFGTVDDCVTAAYCFAKAQRKTRLVDWVYSQPDDTRPPGKRKAHMMIEELSVLFNKWASETLIDSEQTRRCTPLRCQAKPEPQKIEEFKQKCSDLIPLSFSVRHKVDHEDQEPNCENFRVLTEVWDDIQAAARDDDIDKMVDLIAADDIHPLLQPVTDQFRRCLNRAQNICSNSARAHTGHYSLNLKYYTQASSPIRRYMDIVLQRLLHSHICGKAVEYGPLEIASLYSQFEINMRNAKAYEQKAEQISYAVSMKKQSAAKLAFVVYPKADCLAVALPFDRNIFTETLLIMYKDLQLCDQPDFDEENGCVTLEWRRRIYAVDNTQIHQELNLPGRNPYVELPVEAWTAAARAIDEEDWQTVKLIAMEADTRRAERHNVPPLARGEEQEEQRHEVDIKLQLQRGDTLQIQMTTEAKRGYNTPVVQLVRVKPKFELCVHHVHSPITCFCVSADYPSRINYRDIDEYVWIWKPMCKMESASSAVSQSESIVIEDLVVTFDQQQEEDTLTGSFFLAKEWITEWAIECDLSKCLLCIRKRGLRPTKTPEQSALVDPKGFTWVAHGVSKGVTQKKTPPNNGSRVEFYVNHLAMVPTPPCVFQRDTRFTVEIIPKLLPNIRTEGALENVRGACDLVKAIALGQYIPREVQAVWNPPGRRLPTGLPQMNQSQNTAVAKALNSAFTLIQGPPGTGKTVVGVYIVLSFLALNRDQWRMENPDPDKRPVILYCGPSNKSVDVVAEFLLKYGKDVRPLRVYGQQVESQDYPIPDFALQFSQRISGVERAKEELRSITMHHRMRQDGNPYSAEIREFDQRIQLALENDGRNLTPEEMKEYKDLLRQARTHELQQHDVILCTCTQSSTPGLVKTVSARQILIDECAMATEPQALIPLVCNKPEKIVLIGDHKQLRPIVKNERVKKLGMSKSLFERYYTMHKNRAVMLDTQYRMHESICEFPSKEYYEGKLRTGSPQPSSLLRVNDRTMPIVFGNIKGTTVSLVVQTAKGNENSKANIMERDKVIDIAGKLVRDGKIEQRSIVILSPYNAQVSEIREQLKRKNLEDIAITTITKSQGSEWRYVIISTVCSLPSEEIEPEPEGSWLSKHVGFVGDPNQINVGITRAKEGLCIIGDQELLKCSPSWRNLLKHYRLNNAVTNAADISVCAAT